MNTTDKTAVTDSRTVASDAPKDETRDIVISLMRHALEDARLSEITASRNSQWHVADDCRNIAIAIDKLLSSIPKP